MANRDQFNLALKERRRRTFSESFKKGKVREIELGLKYRAGNKNK